VPKTDSHCTSPTRPISARISAVESSVIFWQPITATMRCRPARIAIQAVRIAALPDEAWQLLFPLRHWDIVSVEAAKNQLNPSLIMGLIRQESAFNEKARSSADARGLMQLLPTTASKLARQAGIPRYKAEKLFQAETNIILGTRYLDFLMQRYGRTELALAAYNAGSTRVDLWLKEFGDVDMPEFVERIPFSETRGYIKQVLSNQAFYGLLTSSAVPKTR